MNPKSPRVLQIGKHFYPDNGGIEAVTRAISEMLSAHDIRADVLATEAVPGHYPALSLDYDVIRCRPTLRYGNKNASLSYVNAVRRLETRYDLAIVHLPNPIAVAAILAFWRKPLILFWHADIPYRMLRWLLAPLDRRLARRAAAIVALTPVHLRESMFSDVLVPRGVVIGYPIDRSSLVAPAEGTPAGMRARTFLAGRKLLLAVGRLVPYKGFDVLVEAARDFPPDLATIIVGEGPCRAELEAAIAGAQLSDRVILSGSVSQQELNELLDLTYVGCMPSTTAQEMYGVVQSEFMAYGKPVISTRIARSGVSWVNRDEETGLLVAPGSASELAQAIRRLLGDQILYARLSAGAALSFARNNDSSAIGNDWAKLVHSVAGNESIPAHLRLDCGGAN